jgi:hypothetical protein
MMDDIAALIVPQWFIEAKDNGTSEVELKAALRAYGEKVSKFRMETTEDATSTPDEGWLEATYELYTTYYRKAKGDEEV